MISYELAKQLKDVGFPQMQTIIDFDENKTIKGGEGKSVMVGDELVYIPTLSELIEACGYRFAALARVGDLYYVNEGFESETPEVAVANLWLALNKHD